MQRRQPDIAKAQATFNFQPRRNLRQILADIIRDVRPHLECRPPVVTPNP
jgi:nucleoside-diphosphate-sugar epimerase